MRFLRKMRFKRKEDLEAKINNVETLLIDLVEELGYVVATDNLDGRFSYYELKKVKDEQAKED